MKNDDLSSQPYGRWIEIERWKETNLNVEEGTNNSIVWGNIFLGWLVDEPSFQLSLDQILEEGHWLEEGEFERIIAFSLAKGQKTYFRRWRVPWRGKKFLGFFSHLYENWYVCDVRTIGER
jgi:hypothetical protein